jgi:CBS domain-containing protein
MLVSQILKAKGDLVFTAAPTETVASVASLLNARRVGALVILEADEVAGIFSERDLVRALADDGPGALSTPIARYMTRDVLFAEPGETVESLLTRMTDRRIRHLPVVEDGEVVGVVSIGDLVKFKSKQQSFEIQYLTDYITAG